MFLIENVCLIKIPFSMFEYSKHSMHNSCQKFSLAISICFLLLYLFTIQHSTCGCFHMAKSNCIFVNLAVNRNRLRTSSRFCPSTHIRIVGDIYLCLAPSSSLIRQHGKYVSYDLSLPLSAHVRAFHSC